MRIPRVDCVKITAPHHSPKKLTRIYSTIPRILLDLPIKNHNAPSTPPHSTKHPTTPIARKSSFPTKITPSHPKNASKAPLKVSKSQSLMTIGRWSTIISAILWRIQPSARNGRPKTQSRKRTSRSQQKRKRLLLSIALNCTACAPPPLSSRISLAR